MAAAPPGLERLHRGEMLCRVSLGLTCYLPDAPTRDEVLRAYSVYRSLCPADRRTLVSNARNPFFFPMEKDDLTQVNGCLAAQDRRRDEGLVVWDGNDSEQWSFWMQGFMSPAGVPAASFCQILIPETIDPEVLHELARGLAGTLPMLSGHGGYTVHYNARLKQRAFNQIYGWSKRFLGIEVEDLPRTLPFVLNAVKGANWLTLIGRSLWRRLAGADVVAPFLSPVSSEPLAEALLIRAGEMPSLADRHRGEFPNLYADVERTLLAIKVTDHPEFDGRFAESDETNAWLRRLVDPDRW